MATIPARFPLFVLTLLVLLPSLTSAHQPRITEGRITEVTDPEISKAYYAKLAGEPDVYIVRASEPFELYVNVLVPDVAGQKKDVSAAIIKDGDSENPVAVLDGMSFEWTQFYEPFGADSYWKGPEYKAKAEAGTYEIRVWSSNNDSVYSLAIGEIESFGFTEIIKTYGTIPQIKSLYFDKPAYMAILSPVLAVPAIIILLVLSGIGIFVWRKSRRLK